MFNIQKKKPLTATLAKITSFMDELSKGIIINETTNADIQNTIAGLEEEQKANTNEIELANSILGKLQV